MSLKKIKKTSLNSSQHYIKEHSLHVVDIGIGRPQDNWVLVSCDLWYLKENSFAEPNPFQVRQGENVFFQYRFDWLVAIQVQEIYNGRVPAQILASRIIGALLFSTLIFRPGGWGGTPIWNRRGCSSEILNLTPKGPSGRGSSFLWPLKETNLGVA